MSAENPQRVKQSLVIRTGLSLAGVILASMVGIVASALTAESVDGDAATINLAGSLRMQAYRIAKTILVSGHDSILLITEVEDFDARITSPLLKSITVRNTRTDLKQSYGKLITHWQTELMPMLLDRKIGQDKHHPYLGLVDDFVVELDGMVYLIEEGSASKIKLLRIIQFICMALTILIVFITLINIQINVVNPLKELVVNARRIQEGEFASRVNYEGDNELGLLSAGFNQMAQQLSQLYSELESRVDEKTAELSRSNESLTLLYDSSRKLNEEKQQLQPVIADILQELKQTTDMDNIALCLREGEDGGYYCTYTSGSKQPSFCRKPDCKEQIEGLKGESGWVLGKNDNGDTALTAVFSVAKQPTYFGELVVQRNSGVVIENWQNQLLIAVADILATGLSLQQKNEQQAHLMLMEERATIARELHDSLAQALSYQKIQVVRLKKAMENNADQQTLDQVTEDIREGLNSAYRQLRELLTTFRLKLDAPGLDPALVATLAEFGERSEISFDYDYRLGHVQLNPNEEIHCLQIIREALSNVVRHSRATKAKLSVMQRDDGSINIQVDDNGIGLPDEPEKLNHYGLAIMQERTRSLQGKLSFCTSALGGNGVDLVFTPEVLRA